MKRFALVLSLFVLSACAVTGRHDAQPAMAVKFDFGKDFHEWTVESESRTGNSITTYLVPKGQTSRKCDAMISNLIIFTDDSVSSAVARWKAHLAQTEPDAAVSNEVVATDGSTVLEYRLAKDDTIAIQKFMKGPDGIYILIYNTRKVTLDPQTYSLWREIIAGAGLVPKQSARK